MSLEPAIQSTERLPRRPVHLCDVELGLIDLPLRDPSMRTRRSAFVVLCDGGPFAWVTLT